MNQFIGKISMLQTAGHLTMATIQLAPNIHFTSIVIDTPESAPYLHKEEAVKLIFKETEVMVSSDLSPKNSLQNRIQGSIVKFDLGQLLCRLVLDTAIGHVVAIIPSTAAKQLSLGEGMRVLALVKTNDVILSPAI